MKTATVGRAKCLGCGRVVALLRDSRGYRLPAHYLPFAMRPSSDRKWCTRRKPLVTQDAASGETA